MPASLVVAAIWGSEIAAAAALGSLGYAAVTFGIRLVTTMIISSIIAKRAASDIRDNAQAQLGNRIQLPPSTDNKIGVVYGSAYMKPIVVDAKISTDNKTMWYVLVFSEAMENDSIGTFSYGDIYWGDKKLNFDETDQTKVVSWTDSNGQTDTKAADKIHMYLYRDGSEAPLNTTLKAWEVLQDENIDAANQWDTTKKMSKLVFAICKLNYDQDAGITGLAEISAVINNTLSKPGSVIKDYLMNQRYGAGLDIARVNTTSLDELDAYSDETISYTPAGGGSPLTTPRYRINGPVDTTKNFLDNLNQLCDSCDTWLSYNEKNNNWTVVINRSIYDLDPTGAGIRNVNASNIIGGINLHPMDLNQSYSSVEIQYPNTAIRDQPSYYVLDISDFPLVVRSANEPDNKLSIALPYTNNQVQAQYIAGRRLLQSREDLSVTFTMDHSGIQVDAGDVIAINHERYGWTSKLFRVNQVQESKSADGSLFAQITASEYNDGVYDDNNLDLQDFTLDLNTGITDPTYLVTPFGPYWDNVVESASVPSFDVHNVIPTTGTVVAVEFWYSQEEDLLTNNYTLWTTALPSTGNAWEPDSTATITVTGLTNGSYFWRTRLVGLRSKSGFSAPTSQIDWNANPIGTIVGQNFEAHFVPTTVSIRKDSSGTVFYSSVAPRLYGQSGGGIINFSTATTDTSPAFLNNTWRIGSNTTTNYTSIVLTNVTLNRAPINGTTYAQWSSPTAMSTSTGSMFVPIRYKNDLGEIYQAIPATQQFQIVSDGTNGIDGTGTNGLDGKDGFASFVYVPISVEPTAASNAQRSAAWLAATTRDPVYLDNGTFWGPTTHKNYTYYGTDTQWVAATVFIDGDLVSTGTIRGAALVADAIYGKSFQSNNATLNDTTSTGTWINGQNGNARFAGSISIGNNATIGNNLTVGTNLLVGSSASIGTDLTIGNNCYIGANLTVAGLVNGGVLAPNVVTTATLSSALQQQITGSSGSYGTNNYATSVTGGTGSWDYSVTIATNGNNTTWGPNYQGLHRVDNIGYIDINPTWLSSKGTLNVNWSGIMAATFPATGWGVRDFSIYLWANDGSTNLTSNSVWLGTLAYYNIDQYYSSPVNNAILFSGQTGTLISRLQALTAPRLCLGIALYSSDDYGPISYSYTNINFTIS